MTQKDVFDSRRKRREKAMQKHELMDSSGLWRLIRKLKKLQELMLEPLNHVRPPGSGERVRWKREASLPEILIDTGRCHH